MSFGSRTLVFSTDICRWKDAVGDCGKDASRWVAMELSFHSDFDPNWKLLTCRSVSWPLLLTNVFGEVSAGLGK